MSINSRLSVIVLSSILAWFAGMLWIPPVVAMVIWIIVLFIVALWPPEPTKTDEAAARLAQEAPMIKLVDAIIRQAIIDNITYVVIQPRPTAISVLYSSHGGVPYEAMAIPRNLREPLVNRLKVMAGIDPLDRTNANSGDIEVPWEGKNYLLQSETFFTEIDLGGDYDDLVRKTNQEGFKFSIQEKVA